MFSLIKKTQHHFFQTHDRMWRKTRRPNNESALNCVGTDANRNWGFHWNATDGASTDPCSKNFMGPHPFSEVLHTCHPFLRKSSDWDCERPRLLASPQRPVEVLHEPALLWGDGPPALGLHWGEAWQHWPADWGDHLRIQRSPKSCQNSNILSAGGNTGRWCDEGRLSGAKFSRLWFITWFIAWSIVWAGWLYPLPDVPSKWQYSWLDLGSCRHPLQVDGSRLQKKH